VINREDEERARNMPAKRAVRISGTGVEKTPIENAVPASRAAAGLPPEAFVFLSVGELNKGKNQGLLIRAFAPVSRQYPNAFLLLAGEGAMSAKYKKLAASLGLTGKVLFLGWRDDIPALAAMADVVVSASRREGLPVSLIEAMMAAKPLIASPCRGNRELAEQGGVAADGEKEFTEAMLLLANDAETRERLGKAAKAASEQYEAAVVDAEMEAVYQSLFR
jgi:glycosyltransferase EpsD